MKKQTGIKKMIMVSLLTLTSIVAFSTAVCAINPQPEPPGIQLLPVDYTINLTVNQISLR